METYPDGRAFIAVQSHELYACFIYYTASQAIQGVYFADDGALSDAPKTGVARANPEVVDGRGDEGCASARPRRGCGRFRSGMPTSNDYNIVSSRKISVSFGLRRGPSTAHPYERSVSEEVAKDRAGLKYRARPMRSGGRITLWRGRISVSVKAMW